MYSREEIKAKTHEIHCKICEGDLAGAVIIANDLKFQCPDDCDAMEARAALCIENLEVKEAMALLDAAIAKAPTVGCDKYLMRAELKDKEQAIEDYEAAIEILKRDIAEGVSSESHPTTFGNFDMVEDSLQRKLCRAYCSLATEQSVLALQGVEEDSEVPDVPEFLSSMQKAKEADETYVEVHTLMASYEIRKNNNEAAKEILESSRSHWHPEQCEEFLSWDQGIKITLAKVLSDVKMYEDAETVLIENLESSEEDRESMELLAELYFERGETGDQERAKIYCRQAIKSTQREGAQSSEEEAKELEEDFNRLMDLYAGINQELGLEMEDGLEGNDDEESDDDEEIERELMEQSCGHESDEEMDDD